MPVLFAVSLGRPVDIGGAYLAVGILAWGGTMAATGLFAGSVLGTLALVRHAEATHLGAPLRHTLGGFIVEPRCLLHGRVCAYFFSDSRASSPLPYPRRLDVAGPPDAGGSVFVVQLQPAP